VHTRRGRDPGVLYLDLAQAFGHPMSERIEAPSTRDKMQQHAHLTPQTITFTELAGEAITRIIDTAPGNGENIGGIKIESRNGWFAARPSDTEALYKIYAESFSDAPHLHHIPSEAQPVVERALEIQVQEHAA
jgi:phosphoglucomutase